MHEKFTASYEEFGDAIFRFSLTRVSNREQALDITQETFAKFWYALVKGSEVRNCRVYLFTIAHHLIIDWYRKKKPISLDSLTDEETGKPYEPVDENAQQKLELGAEGRYLIKALDKLESGSRHILYLRFIEDLPPRDISEVLNISANAVSVRVNRALAKLREITGYNIPDDK